MDVKSLKRMLNEYEENRIILMGEPIPNTDKMGWDNAELIEHNGQLYFVCSGAIGKELFNGR